MPNIETAAANWARDAAQGVQTNWKPGVDEAAARGAYCAGIARFMGGSAAKCQQSAGPNWQSGIAGTSTAEVVQGIQRAATENKWANGLRRRFG